MTIMPTRWSVAQLTADAATSSAHFRAARLAVSADAWATHYDAARAKFDLLFDKLDNLDPAGLSDAKLAAAYGSGLGDALRYLAGPPVSADDLKVIADVKSLAPNILKKKPDAVRKVFDVIERVIDSHRFPWIESGTAPTEEQKEAALMASSVLWAAQRIATQRRNQGKDVQETKVKDYLRGLGFTEVPTMAITTIVKGPQAMQFCAECQLGERKADVVLRLHDTRLMALECKVSNSGTNSIKRLNNDAAVKAEYWLKDFGAIQVVPAAVVSGVIKLKNLEQAQKRGLALLWAHDLDKLGAFIESTK